MKSSLRPRRTDLKLLPAIPVAGGHYAIYLLTMAGDVSLVGLQSDEADIPGGRARAETGLEAILTPFNLIARMLLVLCVVVN